MRPTDILVKEHETVLMALDLLTPMAERMVSGSAEARVDLSKLLEFFREFVDRCHHGKEELALFPELVEMGVPSAGGPVGVMLHEHEVGRDYIRQLQDRLDKGSASVLKVALGYRGLLEAHIQKENQVLFPMAERILSEEKKARLAAAFDQIEREHAGEGRLEAYHQMLQDLGKRYSP